MEYITATQAAQIIGYTTARALTKIFQDPGKCPACVQMVGGKWIVPRKWALKAKEKMESMGVMPGGTGRPKGRKALDYKSI